MKKQLFDQLVESIRQAGEIRRGDRAPSRKFVFQRNFKGREVDDFIDLAGSVHVSPQTKGTAWPAIKTSTWRRRGAKNRK